MENESVEQFAVRLLEDETDPGTRMEVIRIVLERKVERERQERIEGRVVVGILIALAVFVVVWSFVGASGAFK